MTPRFGRTEYIVVFDETTNELSVLIIVQLKTKLMEQELQHRRRHSNSNPMLITGNGQDNAAMALEKMDMKIFVGAQDLTLKQALEKYRKGVEVLLIRNEYTE